MNPLKIIALSVAGIISLFLIGLGSLTLLDKVNPYQSTRLTYLLKLGLVRNEQIAKILEPKQPEAKNLGPTGVIFYPYDQKTLSAGQGYECRLKGKLLPVIQDKWQVEAKNGQVFTFEITSPQIRFYQVLMEGDGSTKDRYNFRSLSTKNFQSGDLVALAWRCPVADPGRMFNENKTVKNEYLTITPLSVTLLEGRGLLE